MTSPRQRFLDNLKERGERPTPTADEVVEKPIRLGWRGRLVAIAGFGLPIVLMGGFLVSQLPWSEWSSQWNAMTGFGGYGGQTYHLGPTVTANATAADPAAQPGEFDWDVLPAVLLANDPLAASPPEFFNEGRVSSANTRPGNPIGLPQGGFRIDTRASASLPRPAVIDGKVIIAAGFGDYDLHAVDLDTGQPLWSSALSDNGPSAVAADDGVCVVNTESCSVFAVDAETGKAKWSWYLGDPQVAAPAVAAGRVFTSYPAGGGNVVEIEDDNGQPTGETMAMTHVLACFDLHTGRIIWQKWIDGDVITQPVPAADGRVYVATLGGTMAAFDMVDGTPRLARRNRVTTAPTIVGSHLVFGRRIDAVGQPVREALVRAELSDGIEGLRFTERDAPQLDANVQRASTWGSTGRHLDAAAGLGPGAAGNGASLIGAGTVATLQAYQGSRPVIDDGRVIATMGDAVLAWELESGEPLWQHDLPGDLKKSGGSLATLPVVAEDAVVIGELHGVLRVLDPQTGQTRYDWPTDLRFRVPPVVHDGRLIAASENGELRVMPLEVERWHSATPVAVSGG
ncbi:MAG: PQQ-binding-like beta-propeller repeat protein [Planctomycetota bacterium]